MKGIDVFRKYFKEYKGQYVLIGGAACDLLLSDTGIEPRVTKDLDIVLIVEALMPEFGRRIWDFIRDGGYKNKVKTNGSPQFYRFDEPENAAYPYMIELLSRQEGMLVNDGGIVPMPIGDSISSLSAILLNHEYYRLLFEGKQTVSDVSVLSAPYLLAFKVKAWLDLTERKIQGEHINSRDISKHITDVVRLAASLSGEQRCDLPGEVLSDMQEFIGRFESAPIDPRSMKLKGISAEDILGVLKRVYL
jgi:hypothetical protein